MGIDLQMPLVRLMELEDVAPIKVRQAYGGCVLMQTHDGYEVQHYNHYATEPDRVVTLTDAQAEGLYRSLVSTLRWEGKQAWANINWSIMDTARRMVEMSIVCVDVEAMERRLEMQSKGRLPGEDFWREYNNGEGA